VTTPTVPGGGTAPSLDNIWAKLLALEARVGTAQSAGWTSPLVAIKPANEGRTATTLAADNDLIINGLVAASYLVVASLIFKGGAGASAGFFQWTYSTPTLVTQQFYVAGYASPSAVQWDGHQWSDTAQWGNTVGTTTDLGMIHMGIMQASASGSLQLKWGCHVNTGTNTTLETNSSLTAWRVA
jgi:hypothetical protein